MKNFSALNSRILGIFLFVLSLFAFSTDALAVRGLIFRVDIGTFKTKIDQNKLIGYNYIIVDKNDGLFHYHVGEYADYIHAQKGRNQLYEKGFIASDVVAYFNNNQVTMDDAFALMDNQNAADRADYEVPTSVSVTELNRLLDKNAVDAKEKFVVQVGAFSSAKPDHHFDHLPFKVVEIKTPGGTYKYTSEAFDTKEKAEQAKEKAKRAGVKDAFVVKKKPEAGTVTGEKKQHN